jgi:hypothetical protein
MEETCEFVSSYGILRSCSIRSQNPTSSNKTLDIAIYLSAKAGYTLYVCNSAIRSFAAFVAPFLREPYVLVSGDSDTEMPYGALTTDELQTLLERPTLKHWFCQNLLTQHPKISHMPIGLDYHTLRNHLGTGHPWGAGATPQDQEAMLKVFRSRNRSWRERDLLCYSNFHHAVWGIGQRGDRQEVLQTVPHELIRLEEQFASRTICWAHQQECVFVLSPRGGGYDCHRTWEALLLGCIPIVKSSGMDTLYEGLPVLIVKEWSDITRDLLERTIDMFETQRFDMERLTLQYWTKKMKNYV